MTRSADQNRTPEPLPPQEHLAKLRRLGHISLAVVIGLAFFGYFVGTSVDTSPGDTVIYHSPAPTQATDVPAAPRYSEIGAAAVGPNVQWDNRLSKLATPQPDPFSASKASDQQRMAGLASRAQRRAYNGAPPTVPHTIHQMNPASCLACHGEGKQIGTLQARKMSHQLYTNCTQCHVPSSNATLDAASPPAIAPNQFDGVAAPTAGDRAWIGAPPTVPHTTWMRENCNSCHGVHGEKGLQTSHPWRNNCLQCHAPSAELEQRVGQADWARVQSPLLNNTTPTPSENVHE